MPGHPEEQDRGRGAHHRGLPGDAGRPPATPRARRAPYPGNCRVRNRRLRNRCLRKERGKPLAPFARAAAALPAEAWTTRSRLKQYGILRHPAIPRQKGISCVAALLNTAEGGLLVLTELTEKSVGAPSNSPTLRLLRNYQIRTM